MVPACIAHPQCTLWLCGPTLEHGWGRLARSVVVATDIDREISRRLRETRKRAQWTQEQLAEHVQIDPATMSGYETARLPVPLRVLWRAAQALGVQLTTLVDVERELPKKLAAAPGEGRKPRRREEDELLEAWGALAPRERRVVLALCRTLKKTR